VAVVATGFRFAGLRAATGDPVAPNVRQMSGALMVAGFPPKDDRQQHPAPNPAPLESSSPGDAGNLTLCAGCGRILRLTDDQAVIAEAEAIALDVVTMAFCRGCRGKVA
jgi:hypothetical protein